MATCGQIERMCTGDTERVGPIRSYLKLSVLTLSGMYFTNWSLKYLNYPTRVLFKSSKLLPTMVAGTLMLGSCGLDDDVAMALAAPNPSASPSASRERIRVHI